MLTACAEGIVRVAEAQMLGALRVMSVERGIDPRGFALMPFGGAGPLHAAALARRLGISRVLCPRACGVLCALGLAAAAPRRDAARTVMLEQRSLSERVFGEERETLIAEARAALAREPARVRVRHELRYRGQSFELAVEEELATGPTRRRSTRPRCAPRSRERTSCATATPTRTPRSSWSTCACRCGGPRPLRACAAAQRRRRARSSGRSSSTGAPSPRPCCAASSLLARACADRRCARCRRRRCSSPPAGRGASTSTAPSACSTRRRA